MICTGLTLDSSNGANVFIADWSLSDKLDFCPATNLAGRLWFISCFNGISAEASPNAVKRCTEVGRRIIPLYSAVKENKKKHIFWEGLPC